MNYVFKRFLMASPLQATMLRCFEAYWWVLRGPMIFRACEKFLFLYHVIYVMREHLLWDFFCKYPQYNIISKEKKTNQSGYFQKLLTVQGKARLRNEFSCFLKLYLIIQMHQLILQFYLLMKFEFTQLVKSRNSI